MGRASKSKEMVEDWLHERVVCESEVCTVLYLKELCATELCVTVSCVKELYVKQLCVTKLCGNVVRGGKEEEEEAAAVYKAEKREPHTMLRGTKPVFCVTLKKSRGLILILKAAQKRQ